MSEPVIDREAMGRLAKALGFILSADHPTTVALAHRVRDRDREGYQGGAHAVPALEAGRPAGGLVHAGWRMSTAPHQCRALNCRRAHRAARAAPTRPSGRASRSKATRCSISFRRSSSTSAMSGMRFEGERCSALVGTIGCTTSCSIYDVRPQVLPGLPTGR